MQPVRQSVDNLKAYSVFSLALLRPLTPRDENSYHACREEACGNDGDRLPCLATRRAVISTRSCSGSSLVVESIAMDDGSGPAVVACTRCGAPVHQALMGIDFDPKGSEAPAIEITVGATSGAAPRNLTHVINDPTRIWIEEDPDGLGTAVEIESREEGVTKVLFERALPLPP